MESAALPGPPVDLRQLRVGGGHRRASAGGESDAAAPAAVAAATSGLHGMLAGLQIFDRPIRAHKEVCDGSAPGLLGWWAFAGACGAKLPPALSIPCCTCTCDAMMLSCTIVARHACLSLLCYAVYAHQSSNRQTLRVW